MKLPHVNGSSESCHGSCDVPCLGSALRVRSAVRDCFQSRMIAYARSRLAQVQGGTLYNFLPDREPKIQNILMMKERQYDDTWPDRPLHLQCSWPWWEALQIFTTFQSLSPPPCSKWNANWEGGGNLLFLAACSSPLAGDVDSFVSFRVLNSEMTTLPIWILL